MEEGSIHEDAILAVLVVEADELTIATVVFTGVLEVGVDGRGGEDEEEDDEN